MRNGLPTSCHERQEKPSDQRASSRLAARRVVREKLLEFGDVPRANQIEPTLHFESHSARTSRFSGSPHRQCQPLCIALTGNWRQNYGGKLRAIDVNQSQGSSVSHYFALASGSRLSEFEIISLLGYGGFGITYLAQDTLLEELVALKEFFPSHGAVRVNDATVRAKSDEDQPEFEAGLRSFLGEARLMARFRHRNIAQVRRFFEQQGTGYIVQDFEPGQTLGRRLNAGPLGEAELRTLLSGVLDGLEMVHERAILHRDLKPDNIIIREDGSPVLIDFGAARDFAGRHSRSITTIASGGYTPPEQWGLEGQQGPWSDLYALGAIAYRCVTGNSPPVSLQRLRNDPLIPAATAVAGRYAPELLEAIDWMLAIDEDKRPSSVMAVRETLQGTSHASRTAPVSPTALEIERTHSGQAVLTFDRDIESDVLELAFQAIPPQSYLGSSPDRAVWSAIPHYFPLYRSGTTSRNTFVVEAEIACHIPDGAQVSVISRDGFIRGAGKWPTAPAPTAPPERVGFGRAAMAAGFLAALAALAGGSYFYGIRNAERAEAQHRQFVQQLDDARFDKDAIERVLNFCSPTCPPDVKDTAQAHLETIATEEQTYQSAQNDLAKLLLYISNCKACVHRADAQAKVQAIGSVAERARLLDKLAATNGTSFAVHQFLLQCGSSCPADIRSRAQSRLNTIEIEERDFDQAAQANDVRRLNDYISSCQECAFLDLARRKVAELSDYFDFTICNHSGRKTSVAISGIRKDDSVYRVIGWFIFKNGECSSVGKYKSGHIYYAAQVYGNNSITWQGTLSLCVRDKAFDRRNPPGYTCKRGERLMKFYDQTVSGGSYTWTMSP
jgi:serine/threonine protein kinase/uncharacterized membrane protein